MSVRLFLIECLNPIDLLQERSEAQVLHKICRLIGHEVASFQIHAVHEFRTICEYISAVTWYEGAKTTQQPPICIHISAHGNSRCLAIGKDDVSWSEISK